MNKIQIFNKRTFIILVLQIVISFYFQLAVIVTATSSTNGVTTTTTTTSTIHLKSNNNKNKNSIMAPANKLTLTYFDIEGVAEAVRLALILSKTSYDDVRVKRAEWKELKPKTPGGQLPILTITEDDGSVTTRTQSQAMLRWIGYTYSKTLYSMDKLFDIEETLGIVEDIQRAFMPAFRMGASPSSLGYDDEEYVKSDEYKNKIKLYREKFVNDELPKYLNMLSKRMELHGGKYLVSGTEPTIVDCYAIPFLRSLTRGHIDYIDPECLNNYPKIVQYIKDFCSLDGIQGRYNNGIY